MRRRKQLIHSLPGSPRCRFGAAGQPWFALPRVHVTRRMDREIRQYASLCRMGFRRNRED